MRIHDDFRDDGFHILPRKQVRRAQRSRNMIFWQGIMERDRMDGVLPHQLVCPEWLNLDCLEGALCSLQSQRKICIFESEIPGRNFFHLGLIREVTSDQVSINGFDVQARWYSTPDTVEQVLITAVKWDDHYSTVYSRHVPSPPPHVTTKGRGPQMNSVGSH